MSYRFASILLTAALSLSLAACKKDAPATTPTNDDTGDTVAVAAGGPTCAEVGVNVKAELSAGMDADKAQAAADVLVASCNDDAWSEEARRCGVEAKGEEIENCKSFLSPEVGAKLDAQMEAIFGDG